MYLREKKIKALKIKNILSDCLGIFLILVYGNYIITEFAYYRNDPLTAWNAVSMKSAIILFPIGVILVLQAYISRRRINRATFLSGYFEGSLYGSIKCSDIAAVLEKEEKLIRKQMISLRKHYMEKFELKEDKGETVAELYSKKTLCECKNCGAAIEKSIYFTGVCPFCNSSDLFAKVLTDNGFYAITSDVKKAEKKKGFYLSGLLTVKQVLYSIIAIVSGLIGIIGITLLMTEIPHYFDKEYQMEILFSPDNHFSSYELIKADILNMVLFAGVVTAICIPINIWAWIRIYYIYTAKKCAEIFAVWERPFVPAIYLPGVHIFRKAADHGYLKKCTLEVYEDELMVVLARKIVKDRCITCLAPIVGAVDENYVCQYCGRKIMGVICKQ